LYKPLPLTTLITLIALIQKKSKFNQWNQRHQVLSVVKFRIVKQKPSAEAEGLLPGRAESAQSPALTVEDAAGAAS
jgi:hypothetical protein